MDERYAAIYPDLYRRHWWWRVRERVLLRTIDSLLASKAGGARILDVGCGAGLFFDALERYGRVNGIESDPSAVEHSGRWRSRIVIGQLDDGFQTDDRYDLILLLDLLEHVPEPTAVLRRASALLRPDGRVLITVPAFAWLWTMHDEINHHLRRYDGRQLRSTIAGAGLTVDRLSYMFQTLIVPKLLVRAIESVHRRRDPIPAIPSPAINGLMQTWFGLESSLFGWLPFGTSLLVVARR
jgi:2-polyprenyl-3-methyl-5-hydroxy-6-metoxy-1,4-benzoquinol methylase